MVYSISFYILLNVVLIAIASGDYALIISIHSFANPGGLCADTLCPSGRVCTSSCEYSIHACTRQAGARVSIARELGQGECTTSGTNATSIVSDDGRVFPPANPVVFVGRGPSWPVNGRQLHMELQLDNIIPPNLVDRFAIDITIALGSTLRRNYSGIFHLAEVDVTFALTCTENFYGSNCDIFCLVNCTIDHCVGQNCGQNQRCVDGVLNYTCVCDPGYTGPDCSTEFDVCTGVNCNEGSCVEGVGSCVCDPGYTGQFCERRLDGYELQVTIHSFRNPDGRCASELCSPEMCCEIASCPNSCNYFLFLCQRPAGTPVSTSRMENQGDCDAVSTFTSSRIYDGTSFNEDVFGIPNPVVFSGELWPVNGVQVHIEIVDFDLNGNHELIDRLEISITNNVCSTSGRKSYSGYFGLAEIDISFTLQCAENFCGRHCEIFCLENCDIDRSVGVNCGQNQRCVDGVLNYTCVCDPGYTGPDCSTEFDVCTGVNCNEGSCVEGVGSCVCDPGFTGQFCERRLLYELEVTIHSFSNPGAMCADDTCSLDYCCDGFVCSTCNYYFSLCPRPLGSPVSNLGEAYQGNCITVDTSISNGSLGSNFTDNVFGTPNPITFQWPNREVQLYLEILDYDTESDDELIDRFAIDITSPSSVSSTSERRAYSGKFALAEVDLTIRLLCAENFYGPNCDIFCLENCRCIGVNCGQNQRCVDRILDYTCVCDPGFTGEFCEPVETDILSVTLLSTFFEPVETDNLPSVTLLATLIAIFFIVLVVVLIIVAAYCTRKRCKANNSNNVNLSIPNRGALGDHYKEGHEQIPQAPLYETVSIGSNPDYDYPFRNAILNSGHAQNNISCQPCVAYTDSLTLGRSLAELGASGERRV